MNSRTLLYTIIFTSLLLFNVGFVQPATGQTEAPKTAQNATSSSDGGGGGTSRPPHTVAAGTGSSAVEQQYASVSGSGNNYYTETNHHNTATEVNTSPSHISSNSSKSAETGTAAAAPAPAPAQAATTLPTRSLLVSGGAGGTKSLKFTLIAGKSWKFTLKGNSLQSSYKGAELRLHKNVSLNNYIIDDEGWFQYNPQQQQLYAWPALQTKSGTYYFVLLPSGSDFEADSENNVQLEVAASIVVELIKPLYTGVKTAGDINQLIDYEFSLEYLHRLPTYPLLLNQIFSFFETLAKPNTTQTIQTQTTISPLSTNQQVAGGGRVANKLAEYLLLSFSYSQDGEVFAISWSTHPGLQNNTISPIGECRINTISEVVGKLSSLSAGYQSDDEKFTIFYGLDAPGQSGATERSNALKLTLNGPCQRAKIIEELIGASASAVADNNKFLPESTSTAASKTTQPPNIPEKSTEAILTSSTANQSTTPIITELVPPPAGTGNQPRSISHQNGGDSISTELATPSSSSSSSSVEQQPKVQPQAKSLEEFLEISDMQPPLSTPLPNTSILPQLNITSNLSRPISGNNVAIVETSTQSVSVVPTTPRTSTLPASSVAAESTLNEDFMGILDEVMNYLVTVAVPASIIVGTILLLSIIFALCHLYRKRKKSKEFQVRSRFDFRYSSERKGFLKNSSRPVILEADQKSLSMGGTPQHKASGSKQQKISDEERKQYLPMATMYYEASGSAAGDGSRPDK